VKGTVATAESRPAFAGRTRQECKIRSNEFSQLPPQTCPVPLAFSLFFLDTKRLSR